MLIAPVVEWILSRVPSALVNIVSIADRVSPL